MSSTCSGTRRIPDFPIMSMRVLPSKSRNLSPSHVTLSQASRPSTTSASGAFACEARNVFRGKQRVVVMGSAFVGKSQIISQFLYEKFSSRYRKTVEELHRGEYDLPDESSLTLDILDTSGAFSFPAMRDLSISTSNAFILVFSVADEESWNEIVRLREQVNSIQ
jgi:RASD family, member 2